MVLGLSRKYTASPVAPQLPIHIDDFIRVSLFPCQLKETFPNLKSLTITSLSLSLALSKFNMADEVAILKHLQAGLNAAFESIFAIIEKDPTNVKAIADGKEKLVGLSNATIGTALGPAFSLISLSASVC